MTRSSVERPTYHLAVVVDDHEMGSRTSGGRVDLPRRPNILLYRWFGLELTPQVSAHAPC